jgi:hypothetical protein
LFAAICVIIDTIDSAAKTCLAMSGIGQVRDRPPIAAPAALLKQVTRKTGGRKKARPITMRVISESPGRHCAGWIQACNAPSSAPQFSAAGEANPGTDVLLAFSNRRVGEAVTGRASSWDLEFSDLVVAAEQHPSRTVTSHP